MTIPEHKRIYNGAQYRKCLNHQTLEMLSTLSMISATEAVKVFSDVEYRIRSVDGNTHTITVFTNKLWDLILLKLTEVLHYDTSAKRFDWFKMDDNWYVDDDEYGAENWYIVFSIKTIADCLRLSTDADSLTHLYDRIIAAAKILQNVDLTIIDKQQRRYKISGYLNYVGVRDSSDIEDSVMKSNAFFAFFINPKLIDYLATQKPGIYHFNHAWLYLSGQSQNAYAAAKRIGRLYSQNTHNRRLSENVGITTTIGALRTHLPCLNSKADKDNRVALDKAMNAIPATAYGYLNGNKELTFEELTELRLRQAKYDRIKVGVKFFEHPNTSDNDVTDESIMSMNDDNFRANGRSLYSLGEADKLINHTGVLKRPIPQHDSTAGENDVGQNAEEMAAEGIPVVSEESVKGTTLPDGRVIFPDGGTLFPDGRINFPDGSIRLPDGRIIRPLVLYLKQKNLSEDVPRT